MKIKFIQVCFFNSEREYTYKTDDLDIAINDFVIVPTPRGNTVARVSLAKIRKPTYECKKVISKIVLN